MIRMRLAPETDYRELELLKQRAEADWTAVDLRVREILSDVRRRGDDALRDWTQRLDGFRPDGFRVGPEALQEAWAETPADLQAILREAAERIRRFHSLQQERSWTTEAEPGVSLGQRVTPWTGWASMCPAARRLTPPRC